MKAAGGLMDGIRAPEAGGKKTIITGYDDRLAFGLTGALSGASFLSVSV